MQLHCLCMRVAVPRFDLRLQMFLDHDRGNVPATPAVWRTNLHQPTCVNVQRLLKNYFPSLYALLTRRGPTDRSRSKDEAKKVLKEANLALLNASREHVIGHLTFSDWKAFRPTSTSPELGPPPQKKHKTDDAAALPVTSRFRPNTKTTARSAQVHRPRVIDIFYTLASAASRNDCAASWPGLLHNSTPISSIMCIYGRFKA